LHSAPVLRPGLAANGASKRTAHAASLATSVLPRHSINYYNVFRMRRCSQIGLKPREKLAGGGIAPEGEENEDKAEATSKF